MSSDAGMRSIRAVEHCAHLTASTGWSIENGWPKPDDQANTDGEFSIQNLPFSVSGSVWSNKHPKRAPCPLYGRGKAIWTHRIPCLERLERQERFQVPNNWMSEVAGGADMLHPASKRGIMTHFRLLQCSIVCSVGHHIPP